jgi:hypothetical protein
MSYCRYLTLFSFRVLNPEWEIDLYVAKENGVRRTWTGPERQDFCEYTGPDYAHLIPALRVNVIPWELRDPAGESWADRVPMSQQSNFCKWEILGKKGGIYIDMDILFTSPIDRFYEEIKSKDLAICSGNGYFSIGFLASRRDCTFFLDAWRNAFECYNCERYQTAGVENLYDLLGKAFPLKDHTRDWIHILDHLYHEEIVAIPFGLVYPWPWNRMNHVWLDECPIEWLPDGCIGIHWYAGAKISQEYNNRITAETIHTIDNTFTLAARELSKLSTGGLHVRPYQGGKTC